MQGIRKRLINNYMAIALFCVVLLEGLFLITISQYYLGGVEQILWNHAETSATYYNRYSSQEDIQSKATFIFENLDYNETALVEVVDTNGNVVMNNTGYVTGETVRSGDVSGALQGKTSVWHGKNDSGEQLVAIATPLYSNNVLVGVLRYVSSLSPTYEVIARYSIVVFLVGVLVIVIAFLWGNLMARRILIPVQELMRVTGEIATGNYKVSAIKYHNDEIGQLADAVNIMARELTMANQEKNEFISSISHELRTPLTSIKGWTETMQDLSDEPELMAEGLGIIDKETDRLIVLVNDLLDFSKLQANRLTLSKEEFSIPDLLEDIRTQFAVRCGREEVRMTLLTDNQECLVFADYNRLKQVLVNIVDNAMKFTAGRPRAEIKLSSQVLDDQVVMIIEDNGTGISPEDLTRVKEKFYKGSSNKSGTGLGLSIASEIMELHGGTMLIDSTYGKGTKVVLVMPYYYGDVE